jgi:predicted 3-demethylubiquinone-9 3-methyltransferase (glyoxalase superfamily)
MKAKLDVGPEVTPFLMFTGQAEEAMNFYVGLFRNSNALSIKRYGPGQAGREGTVEVAVFTLNGRTFKCIDSRPVHEFNFTPSISFFVTSDDEAKVTRYFEALAKEGKVFMPLGEYPFSRRFGWVQDRFGVSWQISVQ